MRTRTLHSYIPADDLAERWPDWQIQITYLPLEVLLEDPFTLEAFDVGGCVILISPLVPDMELAVAHAICHLDLGHLWQVEEGGLGVRQEADATGLALLRMDRLKVPGA